MQLKRGCSGFWIAMAALALDRITKILAIRALSPYGVKTVIPGLLSWAYALNSGMAFSMLSGRALILAVLTFFLLAGILVHLLRHPQMARLARVGWWLVIGGGIGNLYDRVVLGHVVDFIRLDFINFAIFNVADSCICVGALLVVISAMRMELRKERPNA